MTANPHRLDMVLESLRDSLRVLSILLCNEREVTDLVSIVDLEIFE